MKWFRFIPTERSGLSHYDVLHIAAITRGIHPKDSLWIAESKDEKLDTVITNAFDSVFHQKIDLVGDSIDTPDRMILLDFITRQDDRHLSNIAIKMSGKSESFYPLYDNDRSLFYEDTEETVAQSVANPVNFATSFGYSGTYYDVVCEIAKERRGLKGLVNLDIAENEISDILIEAGFKGYRLDGALQWIWKTIQIIQKLDLHKRKSSRL
jgi:hypothetical protein